MPRKQIEPMSTAPENAVAVQTAEEGYMETTETTETPMEEPTYSGLPRLRSIVEIQTDLKKPIPARFLKSRVGAGNKSLTYYEWHTAVKFLDYYAPGWSFEIRNVIVAEGHIGVVGRLTIRCAEGEIWREDFGGDYEHQDETRRSKGFDPFLDAKQQAFKRCCAQFGFGLDLYTASS